MSDLLGLGASGIGAYSRALGTIGDNIANAQTPGYARRSTVVAEQADNGQSVLHRTQFSANGAMATGLTRSVDPWLIEDARATAADAGQAAARLSGLRAAETALGDGGAGVGQAMTVLFNRADELAANPLDATRRDAFLTSIDDVASSFRSTSQGLARAASGVAAAASTAVDRLNSDMSALTRVNDGLRRARDGSSNQASLLDQRDGLIDSICAVLPVTAAYEAGGCVTLKVAEGTLVDRAANTTVAVASTPGGTLAYTITGGGGNVALRPASGALAGHAAAAAHIGQQSARLDAVAQQFAEQINGQHEAGRDVGGQAGSPLLTGSGAGDMTAVALSRDEVAAADGTTANGNILAFGNLRTSTGGEASFAALVGQQSQAVASATAQESAAGMRSQGAASARNDVSAVDLDREAADLVRYQQAYQASARVIQVARETMQTILNAL